MAARSKAWGFARDGPITPPEGSYGVRCFWVWSPNLDDEKA